MPLPDPTTDLDSELAALPLLPLAQLRERWTTLTGRPLPRVSAALLRLALAWELQASVYGGLSRRSQQRLDRAGNADGTAGTQPRQRLVREWKGTLHTVTIGADDTISWNDRQWKSLSEVAREITGTRWSGPAFFGLKQKRRSA